MSVSSVSAEDVRALVLEEVADPLAALGLRPEEVPDDFDLRAAGVIDSFGLLELIAALEERLGVEVDLDAIDAEQLTVVGPFCRHVAGVRAQ